MYFKFDKCCTLAKKNSKLVHREEGKNYLRSLVISIYKNHCFYITNLKENSICLNVILVNNYLLRLIILKGT